MPPTLVRLLVSALADSRTSFYAKMVLDKLGLQQINVSNPHRIGHLALEIDCFLRDAILRTGKSPLSVIVEPENVSFANPVLIEYFSRYITPISRFSKGDLIGRALSDKGYVTHTAPYAVAMYDTALSYDVFRRWGRRAPLFKLTQDDKARTAEFLHAHGVPESAWFVCVHARSSGYSTSDEHWHSHRNVAISDFTEAMGRVAERGGWCIRMGDATMEPLQPQPQLIDYACSSFKSPRLDVSLIGNCRFFLGCASGLYNVAAMFGKPSALANMTPLSGAYALGTEDLAIPQAVLDANGRMLSIKEIFNSKVADFRLAEEFRNNGFTPKNVLPAEIAALTIEMMDYLDGAVEYSADDVIRQAEFRAFMRPGHYAYGAGSQIGRDYLRSHMSYSFDYSYYVESNPDVRDSGIDPLDHYRQYGRLEGRFPTARAAAEAQGTEITPF